MLGHSHGMALNAYKFGEYEDCEALPDTALNTSRSGRLEKG